MITICILVSILAIVLTLTIIEDIKDGARKQNKHNQKRLWE